MARHGVEAPRPLRAAGSAADEAGCADAVATADLSLAAFFVHRGLRFLGVRRDGPEHEEPQPGPWFYFEAPLDAAAKLAAQYVSSEEHRYDAAVRSLKKVARTSFGHGVLRRRS